MKKIICFLAVLILCLNVTGCSKSATTKQSTSGEQIDLIVFAAASMTETLQEIATMYKEVAPNVNLVFNFDSSGTLKTQIQEGALCDVFISAGQKQMNQLDISASNDINTEGLDFIIGETRVDILENRVALVVPKNNPKNITSYEHMARLLENGDVLMAMGNSDVPVGQYSQKILEYYRLSEDNLALNAVITYGTNVKEVTTQVAASSVDCGIVYSTDAFSAGLDVVDYATAEMCGQVVYPVAVLKTSSNPEAATAFLEYLLTPQPMEVFQSVGFAKVE